MPYDTHAPKTPLTVSVNADMLKDARALDLDLDEVVEMALQTRIAKRRRLVEAEERMRPALEAMSEFHARHGSLADDFPLE